MGRKRKEVGKVYKSASGKRVRLTSAEAKWPPFLGRAPRGKTGSAYPLTVSLKEHSAMVYAFVVSQLRKSGPDRDPMVQPILAEYQEASGIRRAHPASAEFTAFVIERAMDGAWKVWGITPPFSVGEAGSFMRRYVHGHPGALRDFRAILKEPQPWPRDHRGYLLKYFFGKRGEAAREFNLLTTDSPLRHIRVITLFEEKPEPQR